MAQRAASAPELPHCGQGLIRTALCGTCSSWLLQHIQPCTDPRSGLQWLFRLLAEYLTAAPSSLVAEAVETLAGPGLLRIAHTRDGAQAACAVVAYGTPKERKKAVKAMKGLHHT